MFIFIVFILKFLYPSYFSSSFSKKLKRSKSSAVDPAITHNKKCLFFGHPDDEIMFFSPFLLNLSPDQFKNLKIICLTNNDNVRKHELIKCLTYICKNLYSLGSTLPENMIKIFNFPDTMVNSSLNLMLTNQELIDYTHHLRDQHYHFYTFDEFGVSNHQNHKDCLLFLQSALVTQNIVIPEQQSSLRDSEIEKIWKDNINSNIEKFVQQVEKADAAITKNLETNSNSDKLCNSESFRLYKLKSIKLIFKYIFVFCRTKSDVAFSNSFINWWFTFQCFRFSYKTQMRWYRNLWYLFSRFPCINDYERVY